MNFSPGYNLRKLESLEDHVFDGEKLIGDIDKFNNSRGVLVSALVVAIGNRYQNIEGSLLGATKIACLKSWPVTEQTGPKTFSLNPK